MSDPTPTPSAIQRLREQIIATSMDGLTGEQQALVAAFYEFVEDGAAVDALYQAAKAELGGDEKIAEYLEIMERNNTDVVDLTKIPRFALAAAVRRIEGNP